MIDKAIELFEAGLEYGIGGFIVGILYDVFVPVILQAYHLPVWLSAIVMGVISVRSILSDWSGYGKQGFWFAVGVLLIAATTSDFLNAGISLLAMIVIMAKRFHMIKTQ